MKKTPLWDNIYKSPLRLIKFLIIRQAKCWGVEFEKNLPAEFLITEHAEKRLRERFNCVEHKIKKVVVKAWFNRQVVSKEFIILKEMNGYEIVGKNATKYRMFNGFIFVFQTHMDRYSRFQIKRLITVYRQQKTSKIKKLPQFNSNKRKRR